MTFYMPEGAYAKIRLSNFGNSPRMGVPAYLGKPIDEKSVERARKRGQGCVEREKISLKNEKRIVAVVRNYSFFVWGYPHIRFSSIFVDGKSRVAFAATVSARRRGTAYAVGAQATLAFWGPFRNLRCGGLCPHPAELRALHSARAHRP